MKCSFAMKSTMRFPGILSLVMFAMILPGIVFGQPQTSDPVYSVGVVPQFEVRRILEIWDPILAEVSERAGLKLQLQPVPSIPKFEQALEHGLFDFAYMNPYHLLVANEIQGYIPLLRDTGRTLYGIIVVRKDSAIKSIEDLQGKAIAFPAPNALGAALIPRAEFATKYHIMVKPVYVRSHTSVYLNVFLGRIPAGGGVRSTLNIQDPRIVKGLRVLFETTRTPPHPLAAHPRVPQSVREKVARAFIEFGGTAFGAKLLAQIPIKKIGPAKLSDYEPLRSLNLDRFYVRP